MPGALDQLLHWLRQGISKFALDKSYREDFSHPRERISFPSAHHEKVEFV